ncbi:MAG: hypothetical protein ACLR6J_10300 [Parabacteroides merdae]
MGNSEYAGAIGAPFAITVIGGLSFSCIVDADPDPYRLYGTGKHATMVQGAVRESMGSARFALYGRSRLYLVLWWWPPVAVRLWVLLLAGIPGVTYFMQTSLRRARSKVIDPETDIHISVRNLVKIYDWPGRVSRQWKSGLLIRRRLGLEKNYLIPAGLPDDCPVPVPDMGSQKISPDTSSDYVDTTGASAIPLQTRERGFFMELGAGSSSC